MCGVAHGVSLSILHHLHGQRFLQRRIYVPGRDRSQGPRRRDVVLHVLPLTLKASRRGLGLQRPCSQGFLKNPVYDGMLGLFCVILPSGNCTAWGGLWLPLFSCSCPDPSKNFSASALAAFARVSFNTRFLDTRQTIARVVQRARGLEGIVEAAHKQEVDRHSFMHPLAESFLEWPPRPTDDGKS